VKRIIYLAASVLVVVLVLASGALAQDLAPGDDDPYLSEQYVVVVGDEELQQIAGQPLPAGPPAEPVAVPDAPLAETGGFVVPSVLLPAVALLLLGSGVLASYAVHRRRSR
jgi:hypothetical protein